MAGKQRHEIRPYLTKAEQAAFNEGYDACIPQFANDDAQEDERYRGMA